ncbi:hypothetical protein OG411_19200 [Streptomyces pseudogriseolus]|uniref:hypothetical protein n=1 Tax=Streptomyces pseudogriseolus TaxID=36817 RepID=UPI003251B93B
MSAVPGSAPLRAQSTAPRLFHLERDTDVTGVSGTGRVADGVQWPDGTVALRWIGDRPSTTVWGSVDDVAAIHGHGGATRIVWADGQPDRAALRDRITTAISRWHRDPMMPLYEQGADAVLAVLPPFVDRAAILEDAADALDNSKRLRDFTDDHMADVNEAANELRRMAAQARQDGAQQ